MDFSNINFDELVTLNKYHINRLTNIDDEIIKQRIIKKCTTDYPNELVEIKRFLRESFCERGNGTIIKINHPLIMFNFYSNKSQIYKVYENIFTLNNTKIIFGYNYDDSSYEINTCRSRFYKDIDNINKLLMRVNYKITIDKILDIILSINRHNKICNEPESDEDHLILLLKNCDNYILFNFDICNCK